MTESGQNQALSASDRAFAARRLARVLALRGPLLARAAVGHLRPTSRLDDEWRARYERARADIAKNDPAFRPAKQWALISFMFRRMIRGFGLDDFKSTFGRFLAAYEPYNPRYFQALHHVYWSALEKRDELGLLKTIEEPELGGGDTVTVHGRRFTIDLLQSIDEFYRMREVMGWKADDHVTFVEIGAGYGRLAYVVLKAMPNARYVIFDLPESLLLSQYYLTSLFPNDSALLYPDSAEAPDAAKRMAESRMVFGLPHQLRTLARGTVDMVVNIYSFMEMSSPQVAAYFDAIEAIDPRALYIKQHKHEVNALEQSLLTDELYPVRDAWKLAYQGTSQLYEDVFEAVYRIRS
jgi:putative sugar O-methyltransferase